MEPEKKTRKPRATYKAPKKAKEKKATVALVPETKPPVMEPMASQWISPEDALPNDLQQVLIYLKAKYVRPAIGRDWMGWTVADVVFQDMKEVWDKMPAEQRSQYLVEKNFYRLTGRYVWHGQGNNKFSHDDVTHWMALPEGPDV